MSPQFPDGVTLMDPLRDPEWNAQLTDWPAAGVFHTAAWLRVLHDTYGYQPFCLGIGSPGSRRCLFPLIEVDSRLTGRRGICLPFTDECAPLFRDAASVHTVWRAVILLARQRRWKHIECRGGTSWLPGATASTSYHGHQLRLDQPEPALWRNLDDATRRAVRKAQQGPLEIEIARDWTAVRKFYALVCQTRRRQGLPPQPLPFFSNIHRHLFGENGAAWLILAKHDGTPVAGAVFFRHRTQALYKFGASDHRFQHLRANNLVMWEAIRRLREAGDITLDFGRTSLSNEGLRRFKRGWGATERRIDYFRYAPAAGEFVPVPDRSSGWHTAVFRALPAGLSRLVGRFLYRHVA